MRVWTVTVPGHMLRINGSDAPAKAADVHAFAPGDAALLFLKYLGATMTPCCTPDALCAACIREGNEARADIGDTMRFRAKQERARTGKPPWRG